VLAAVLWLSATFRVAMALLLAFHALIHTGFLTREPDRKPGARRGHSGSTDREFYPGSVPHG
jgi:hypothetical protein